MPNDQVFEATKKIFGLYGSFFKTVVQEVGMEKALALHAQAHEEQGIAAGKMLKEKMGEGAIDFQKLGSVLQESNLSIGIDSVLDNANSTSALFKNYQCPMYDGYRMGGLDDETAEALCQKGAAAKLGTMLKYLNPNIHYNLKYYRVKPDEACEEEISMS
ncbi:hypothetical protein ACFLZM_04960 [Thermodesulfobacteriota bacterium]